MNHDHDDGPCAICDGTGSLEERIQALRDDTSRIMDEFGIAVRGVSGGGGEPGFSYSIGMYRLGQPEIIVFGLPVQIAHHLINDVHHMVKEGRGFADGEKTKDLAVGFDTAFKETDPEKARDYATGSFYHAYQEGAEPPVVLQMVWPDRDNRFPWDPGFDSSFDRYQPQLWNTKN